MFDVEVPAKRRGKPPTVVKEDEEYKNVNPEKFKKLATVFQGQSVAFFLKLSFGSNSRISKLNPKKKEISFFRGIEENNQI